MAFINNHDVSVLTRQYLQAGLLSGHEKEVKKQYTLLIYAKELNPRIVRIYVHKGLGRSSKEASV